LAFSLRFSPSTKSRIAPWPGASGGSAPRARTLTGRFFARAPGSPSAPTLPSTESQAFHPEQRLGLAAALRAHLEEPNRLAGWSTPLGRIAPGWGADLVRFDQDLLRIDPGAFHQVNVRGVWVAGAHVYGKSL
jgi:hypothetical protein